jgi:MFS family permease
MRQLDRPLRATAVSYGATTMIALGFANLLQNGELQSFSQSTESLRAAFHVSDFLLGAVPFLMGMSGAIAAIFVGMLSARYKRTLVLASMFALWTIFMGLNGLVVGFGSFLVVRLLVSVTEATDPAAFPLIGDYWPVDQRAAKFSLFNACAGVGSLLGLVMAGPIVDNFGWRWAFLAWVPVGVVGTVLMRSRREPERGARDAEFHDELEELAADHMDVVATIVAADLEVEEEPIAAIDLAMATRWQVFRYVFRLRSWRTAAFAIGVSQIMQTAITFWGTPYFKRTFHLSASDVSMLAPVIGIGSFVGLLGGGFLADRLLLRGVVRARVWVSGIGYLGAAAFLIAAFSARSLWVAAPLLAVGSAFGAVPVGPQYALLIDVTPTPLRSQASAIADIIGFVSALGYVLVGGLSTLLDNNLRLALLCASPVYAIGGLLMLTARRTYVADVALVVAEARQLHEAARNGD